MPQEDETRLRVCDKAVHAGLLTRTCFFGVLGFLLPLLLGSSVDLTGTLDWAPIVAQYAVLLYCAWRLAALAAVGEPAWFIIILHGYSYTWLGLTPLVQYLAGENPLGVYLSGGW